jgi:hypothetical protein
MHRRLIGTLLIGLGIGCQPSFSGNPHIDIATCQARCAKDQLQMTGMVYLGEYSSACLCEVPRPPGAGSGAAAGSMGAATGVVMQMRANQAQSQSWEQSQSSSHQLLPR